MTTYDLLEFAAIAAAVVLGFLAGRVNGRRAEANRRPQAICPCTHHASFHAAGSGPCRAAERQDSRWDQCGSPIAFVYVTCACQVYSGPEVISSLTGRPVTYQELAEPPQQEDQP